MLGTRVLLGLYIRVRPSTLQATLHVDRSLLLFKKPLISEKSQSLNRMQDQFEGQPSRVEHREVGRNAREIRQMNADPRNSSASFNPWLVM